jgi:hypothetical protein
MNVDLGNVYVASGPVESFTIMKFGAKTRADIGDQLVSTVARAGSGADALIGVTGKLPPERLRTVYVDGGPDTFEPLPGPRKRVDVIHAGLASVLLGGAVVNGDFITSDAAGRGVRAVAGDRYVGFALEDGVAGAGIEIIVQVGQLAAPSMPAKK